MGCTVGTICIMLSARQSIRLNGAALSNGGDPLRDAEYDLTVTRQGKHDSMAISHRHHIMPVTLSLGAKVA